MSASDCELQSHVVTSNAKVVDLFCGIGGLSHGLVNEGFNVVVGYDIDQTCKFAFESNNNAKFISKDVSLVTPDEMEKHFEGAKYKILVGCAPCQPFSKYNIKKEKDEKWGLLYKFMDIIDRSTPDIVSMENVPQLIKHDVYHDFVTFLKRKGYYVYASTVYCPDYGIPQKRTRLVLLASKYGKIELISPTHSKKDYLTVWDTIKDLPPIEEGTASIYDPLHIASRISEKNKTRIRASKQGGTWNDWDDSLKLTCHLKDSGKTYSGVYGRMKWNEPASTMTTQCTGIGNGRFGHPEQDRAISLREASLFQTFPINYKFIEDKTQPLRMGVIARQIGNAVPVKLGSIIGKSIKIHLLNKD